MIQIALVSCIVNICYIIFHLTNVIFGFSCNYKFEQQNMVDGEKKIYALIVEDDRVTQMRHRMLLKRFKCESLVAGNGKEAIDLYRSGARFDVVLMDMEMPIMNGVEVCHHKLNSLLSFITFIYSLFYLFVMCGVFN